MGRRKEFIYSVIDESVVKSHAKSNDKNKEHSEKFI